MQSRIGIGWTSILVRSGAGCPSIPFTQDRQVRLFLMTFCATGAQDAGIVFFFLCSTTYGTERGTAATGTTMMVRGDVQRRSKSALDRRDMWGRRLDTFSVGASSSEVINGGRETTLKEWFQSSSHGRTGWTERECLSHGETVRVRHDRLLG